MPLPTKAKPASAPAEVARVAALPGVHAAYEWFRRHQRELAELQLELTRIPAPPFGEAARSAWLAERFRSLGLDEVRIDEVGNVTALRPGSDPGEPYFAVSAHLDTVFPAGLPLDVHADAGKLFGPGISDNSAGVVALLALVSALQQAGLRTTAPLLFIGNVGEEGEGDLRGMRHIFSDPRWQDAIGSTLVIDGAQSETIVTEALGSRRFEVTVSGPGGHSWSDFGAPNAIVLLARAIERFSRTAVPLSPKTTFNVGVISGGTSVNSIAESASMRVDIRSSSPREIDRIETALRQALSAALGDVPAEAAAGNGAGVRHDLRLIGNRPAAELRSPSRLLAVAQAVDAHLGNPSRLTRASTDANIPLALGREAIALGGGGNGGGAHTLHEWYDPRGRDLGLQRLLLLIAAMAGAE